MNNKRRYVTLAVVVIIILLAAGPRVDLEYTIDTVTIPKQIEQYISDSENQFTDIRPGTEKKIIWANKTAHTVTPYSIVYLHGFSATRQEVAPLCDRLANDLSANLYYTRFTGHGRTGSGMQDVSINALLNDAYEALEVGKQLGKKVILIGSSTGGTLATWLSAQKPNGAIAAMVLLSPNFGLKRKESELLLYPWGKTILHLLEGEYYKFTPVNALQEKYWTTRYPVDALLEMIGLVDLVRQNAISTVDTPTLVLYAEKDKIIDVEQVKSQFHRLSSPIKKLVAVSSSTDPQQHILAGDVLSPASTKEVHKTIIEFLAPIVRR